MAFILIGCVLLLGLLLGASGMRRLGRLARGAWRPGAGMLALGTLAGAAFFGVEGKWPVAGVLALVGFSLLSSVRRTAKVRHAPPPSPPAIRMGVIEAASILGVSPDAAEPEIQAAYHRLIKRAHPDQGGTAGLAAQLNAARDTMLKK